jgi:hypothetical protein
MSEMVPPDLPPSKPKLLDAVREVPRSNYYSRRTEEAYGGWIKRFILFHGKRHPEEGQTPEHLRLDRRPEAKTEKRTGPYELTKSGSVPSRQAHKCSDLRKLIGIIGRIGAAPMALRSSPRGSGWTHVCKTHNYLTGRNPELGIRAPKNAADNNG